MSGKKIKDVFYSKKLAPYVFIFPFLLIFFGFYLYPVVNTVVMSFQEILPGQTKFIGFQNYKDLMNPTFYQALYNTTLYTFWTMIILIPLPLLFYIVLIFNFIYLKTFFLYCL